MGRKIESSFSLSILQYRTQLGRYALSLTRSADSADDLVQDCIERALCKQQLYQPDSNLRAWLFTIMRNIFINEIRKDVFRRDYVQHHLVSGQLHTLPSQFHGVALKESLVMMATLSEGEREAILLLGVFNLSYKEASALSGSQICTLKSRARRARTRLKRLSEPASAAG